MAVAALRREEMEAGVGFFDFRPVGVEGAALRRHLVIPAALEDQGGDGAAVQAVPGPEGGVRAEAETLGGVHGQGRRLPAGDALPGQLADGLRRDIEGGAGHDPLHGALSVSARAAQTA